MSERRVRSDTSRLDLSINNGRPSEANASRLAWVSYANRLESQKDELEADNEQLKAFAGDVLYTAFEDCEVDSEYMQASALKHGLLKEVGKSEPCGEACLCADYGIDFPTGCYQFTEVIATPKESTP